MKVIYFNLAASWLLEREDQKNPNLVLGYHYPRFASKWVWSPLKKSLYIIKLPILLLFTLTTQKIEQWEMEFMKLILLQPPESGAFAEVILQRNYPLDILCQPSEDVFHFDISTIHTNPKFVLYLWCPKVSPIPLVFTASNSLWRLNCSHCMKIQESPEGLPCLLISRQK